ncbi:alanine--tRNA ligase [Patescibacteria group bacterium]|nr:alanine--tRNA ligase [Patescibacteria group bacterium]
MRSDNIRKSFLDFFKKKGHQIVPSASLIPADPTALFTSAGMQQFVTYLSGEVEPPYQRACSVQKCFRTSDVDEVGDEFHHTFFEMLGNWSFGDYFKKEAVAWALELLVDNYNLSKDKLWVSIFKGSAAGQAGEKGLPRDNEAEKIWQKNGIPKKKIKEFGLEDNFWGPVGPTGPCGPCSEIYYDRGKDFQQRKCNLPNCGPNCNCGRFVEVWNLVFMEYNKTEKGEYKKLPVQNVDTGAGLERLACVLQNKLSDYETDLFLPLMKEIKKISNSQESEETSRAARIIADHLRGACFLIADGVLPGKEDRGYILRQIIRRAMRFGRLLAMDRKFLIPLAQIVISQYRDVYPELESRRNDILTIIQKEEEKFTKTLNQGLKKFKKLVRETLKQKKKVLDSKTVFHLYDTYGFPFELTKEMAEEKNLKVDEKAFQKDFEHHREVSRAGAKKKFGGVGEWGEKVAPHHTATHLLHQVLRQVLGEHVQQAGSDLTPERLRFDFTHPKKLTEEEIKKVEEIVNQKIKQGLEVEMEEMPYEQAIKKGALAFFKEKYPKTVKVYSIEDFSKEICAGPHVKNTKEIGEFKIVKEQASGAGVRRIRAVIAK